MKANTLLILGFLFLTFSLFSNQVSAPTGGSNCTDSDGGKDYYVKGTTIGLDPNPNDLMMINATDKCSEFNSYDLYEYSCFETTVNNVSGLYFGSETYSCPNGCNDGTCIETPGLRIDEPEEGAIIDSPTTVSFTITNVLGSKILFDSTQRIDLEVSNNTGGSVLWSTGYLPAGFELDPGETITESLVLHPLYVYPEGSAEIRLAHYVKLGPENFGYGSLGFKSINVKVSKEEKCTDSDGGKDYYVKGNLIGYADYAQNIMNMTDCCVQETGGYCKETGPKLSEYYCKEGKYAVETYECPHGCKDGVCVNASCIGEGQSLGPVVPDNKNVCCPGLTAIGAYSPANCQPMLGTYGYCTKCGDGVCKEPENICNCPNDCKTIRCPVLIDMAFNKKVYYAGDYFEVTVKIYDENKNPIPNQVFSIYNDKLGTSQTYYTDANGIYKTTSTVPSDPQYSGEWTFVASVNEGGCNYVSDKETIYINISDNCGNGFCDDNEKEIVCDTACPQIACAENQQCEVVSCKVSCHVKCMKDCTPNCGNGVCENIVCVAAGCPAGENEKNCPQDCSAPNYCGSQSSDPNCVCGEGYMKEKFEVPCGVALENPVSQPVATGGASAATGTSVTGAITASTAECKDSDGGFNYYKKGTCTDSQGNSLTDSCNESVLKEYLCGNDNLCAESHNSPFVCPNGCKEGACIECSSDLDCPQISCPEGGFVHEQCVENECVLKAQCPNTVKEEVKCIFKNSNAEQKCYSDKGFSCSGTGTCVADVYGKSGEKVAWKSTCGGYAYTIIDGVNEYADFDCSSTHMCTYYRCVSAYQYLNIYTDKYSYGLNEPVSIFTSPVGESYLGTRELEVYVRKPYGSGETATLTASCETAESTCSCEVGAYCPPCTSKNWCRYKGAFTGTNEVGGYEVGSYSKATAGFKISPAYFTVYDDALLKKYLILEDIDGFKYKSAQVMPAPENITGYMALYEKIGRQYNAIVFDFETREQLQKMLNTVLQQNPSYSEEKFDGYYIYALKNYGQKVYFWSFKNFLVAVMENMGYAQKAESVLPTPPTPSAPELTGTAERTLQKTEVQKESGFFTGMITSMPFAAESGGTVPVAEVAKHCGDDSLYSECACAGDETKEKFMPSCKPDSACDAGPHYRCVPTEPKELIKAYLDKYPSDIKAIGTDCELKGGYCIYFQDSCKSGFGESSLACSSRSEKCCVKEVNKDDFIEIVFKLEGIRVKMDSFERKASALADYYKSVGDEERAKKFSEVVGMFANAKKMVDDIIAKIRANLENPELIRDDIKQDILALRNYISGILGVMVA